MHSVVAWSASAGGAAATEPAGGGPEEEDVSWVRVRLRDKELRREGVLGRGGELDMRMRGERSRSSWADGR